MADELDFTDHGDGIVTLNNDPAPDQVTIQRVPWQDMVNGALAWATVTQDEDNTQHLAITATNISATFDRLDTLPGRVTLLQTVSWTAV